MKWEYKTVEFSGGFWSRLDRKTIDERLNDYGQQGWELVSLVMTAAGFGAPHAMMAALKRPLS